MNQIERVVEVTGIPSLADINSINSPFTATMLESLPQIAQKKLRDIFPDATPDAMDFLQKCFYFNPDLRPSAEQLLAHPLCADFHNAEEEPIYPYGPIRLPIDDNTKLTAAQYRDRLYQEITDRRKETRRKEQVRAKASVGSSMVTGGASPAVGGGYTTGSAVGGGGGGTNSIIG
jgi:mitogen-activated protein kinase 15